MFWTAASRNFRPRSRKQVGAGGGAPAARAAVSRHAAAEKVQQRVPQQLGDGQGGADGGQQAQRAAAAANAEPDAAVLHLHPATDSILYHVSVSVAARSFPGGFH